MDIQREEERTKDSIHREEHGKREWSKMLRERQNDKKRNNGKDRKRLEHAK